jgi:Salmonella virulence plasmid 28.1kDa A protein
MQLHVACIACYLVSFARRAGVPFKKSRRKGKSKAVSTQATPNQNSFYAQFKSLGFASVFDVLPISKPRFIHLYDGQLGGEARQVYDWAVFYANYIAHYYRAGHSETHSDTVNLNDVLANPDKPTYENLFPEDQGVPVCDPNAIKSQTSPVAYLVDLYQFTKSLGRKGNEDVAPAIRELFEERRPDIEALCITQKSTHQPVEGLQLVNDILEKAIEKKLGDELPANQNLDEFFAYAVYPFELPFYLPYVQILKSLNKKEIALGTIIQQLNRRYPCYLDPCLGFDPNKVYAALDAYSDLTPTQIIVLTSHAVLYPGVTRDEENFPETAYLLEYYGAYVPISFATKASLAKLRLGESLSDQERKALDDLAQGLRLSLANPLDRFLRHTSLTREMLSQLLAEGQYYPNVSDHFTRNANGNAVASATQLDYGSIYVSTGYGGGLNIDPAPDRISGNLSAGRFRRLNQFIRFQKWTGAKPSELDWLIFSTKYLHTPTGNRGLDMATAVSAFGLFNYLSSTYKLSLEEFTALIAIVCPYSVGEEISQFDRLFNANDEQPSLILDNSEFNSEYESEADQQTVRQLCAGLSIESPVLRNLAALLLEAKYLTKLTRSLETVSTFYRLVKLARLFSMTVVEFWQLLHVVVSKPGQIQQFISPQIQTPKSEREPTNLDVLVALEQAAVWLKKLELTPLHLIMILGIEGVEPLLIATPQAMNLFNDLKQALPTLEDVEGEQEQVVSQSIVKLYQVDSALALNLVEWIGKDFASSLLSEVERLKDDVTDQTSLQEKGLEFLKKTYILERYIAAVAVLKLTNTELQFLSSQPEYFGVGTKPVPLNLKAFYELTRLKEWLAASTEPEEKVLSYFSLAHASPPDKQRCVDLLAELMDWESKEIVCMFERLDNADKLAKTVSDIDWMLRVKELSNQTGLSASQLFELVALERDSAYERYAASAQALLAVSEQPVIINP